MSTEKFSITTLLGKIHKIGIIKTTILHIDLEHSRRPVSSIKSCGKGIHLSAIQDLYPALASGFD